MTASPNDLKAAVERVKKYAAWLNNGEPETPYGQWGGGAKADDLRLILSHLSPPEPIARPASPAAEGVALREALEKAHSILMAGNPPFSPREVNARRVLMHALPAPGPSVTEEQVAAEADERPHAYHHEMADFYEWVSRDGTTFSRPVAPDIDALLDIDTKEPIGWRIYGWSRKQPLPSEPAPVDGEYSSLGLKSPTHPAAAWRPIETALKDEEYILASSTGLVWFQCCWDDEDEQWITFNRYLENDQHPKMRGKTFNPTVWVPLPVQQALPAGTERSDCEITPNTAPVDEGERYWAEQCHVLDGEIDAHKARAEALAAAVESEIAVMNGWPYGGSRSVVQDVITRLRAALTDGGGE